MYVPTLSCLVDAKLTIDTQCGLVCRSCRQELRETLHARTSESSLIGRGNGRYPSVNFNHCSFHPKVLDLHVKQLLDAIEQFFLDHADCNFQLLSERLRMLHEFGMRSFTYSFVLLLLVFPKPLSIGSLNVASHIHNLLLDLVHAALFVLRHSLATLLRQCGSHRWRCVLEMVIGHDGDCTSKNCLRSQVLVLHLPRKYKFGERRVEDKLVTCLMHDAQKITSSSSPPWSVRC